MVAMNAQLHHTVAMGRLVDLRVERDARPAAPAATPARPRRRARIALRRRPLRHAA
jgi:hypothetical protein